MSAYENSSRKQASIAKLRPQEQSEVRHLTDSLHKRRLEASLVDFVREAWPVLEPGRQYVHSWHIDAICEYLTAVSQRKIRRLIINVPPRHMKSLLVSVLWPTWEWILHSESRWMFVSYAAALSVKHNIDRRTLIESDWYQTFWRDRFHLTADQNEKGEFSNSRRGVMLATSVGGSATGKGADVLVVDDIHNPLQAESDAQREESVRFFNQTLSTRLNDHGKGAIVIVMQRLHERDLAGQLLERSGWDRLSLPAEAEGPERVILPITGRVIARAPGELLWPERFPRESLNELKRTMGSYAYAGQYQQRPSPIEGGIIKRDWFSFYQLLPAAFDDVVESWDLAFKSTSQSDYVVGQVWGRVGANYFLLDQIRGRLSFGETQAAIINMSMKWPQADAKLIEDKANGPAIVDALKGAVSGLIPVSPQGGKVSRAQAVSAIIEARNVWLPDPNMTPWVDDFVEECVAFPNGAFDDQLDAMTQAIVYMRERATSWPGIFIPPSGSADLDGEELWEKAMAGYPLTEAEIDRLK